MPETVAPGVYRTRAPGRTLAPYRATECYWIGTDEVLLVDAGDGEAAAREALRADWEALGRPRLAGVVVTHRHGDHVGGLAWVQHTWPDAPVYVHPAEADAVRPWTARPERMVPMAEGRLEAGGVTVEVLHAPGHTPGQLNLWLAAERLLLAGDNVLGNTTSVIVPPDGDLLAYLATLRRLLALAPARIAPGHGDLVEDGVGYLNYYLRHRAEREQQVLDLLAAGPRTPEELAARIYSDQPPAAQRAGVAMTRGQLAALVARGRVVEDGTGRFRLAEPGSGPAGVSPRDA
ncbi:MAG: MBL fold metallo-hydrolase [Actinomycetia bacterium]|nr:MBL fold metallo-hydrolase [Actinomycetes bacterium]